MPNHPFAFHLRRAGLLSLFAATLLPACKPDKKADPAPTAPVVTKSVYVVNEGSVNGAISFYNKESKAVNRDVFEARNGRKLGPYVQSMTIVGSKAYLVVNGANQVEVVNLADFAAGAPITGLSQPRYLLAVSGTKAYLTEWLGAFPDYERGRVSVIDLTTNTITKRLRVGVNPEQLLFTENRVYVANSYGTNLTVIDPATDTVVDSVAVPAGPKNLVRDDAGNIWVLCSRYGSAKDHLVRFNPASPAINTDIEFANDYTNGNLRATATGNKVYAVVNGALYPIRPYTSSLPAEPLIRRGFYGLGIDPQDGTIYAGTSPSFTTEGYTVRYTAAGALIDSFQVAVGPNSYLFY